MESGVEEIRLDGLTYRFNFCRKAEEFGSVRVNHWWMPITPLYAQRSRKKSVDGNHKAVTEYYWAVCRVRARTKERRTQETMLLANLVPHVRNQGSRGIFADAFFVKSRSFKDRKRRLDELDAMLASARDNKQTREAFHEQSRISLAKLDYPQGVQEAYDQVIGNLLNEGCALLKDLKTDAANANVLSRWNQLMTTVARRAGHFEEKLALDAISYEARAAFHDCYSVAWLNFLPELRWRHGLSHEDLTFLHFWHLAHNDSGATARGECLRFFHGHVLGLHPGTSPFLQTRTGRELMGEWLVDPESADCFGRLLNGLLICLFSYGTQRDEDQLDRRK